MSTMKKTHRPDPLVSALERQLLSEARHLFRRLSDRLRSCDQLALAAYSTKTESVPEYVEGTTQVIINFADVDVMLNIVR